MDGSVFRIIYNLFFLLIVAVIIFAIYFIYSFFIQDKKTIITTVKPSIEWKLKANGKKIDTVWIYKFK